MHPSQDESGSRPPAWFRWGNVAVGVALLGFIGLIGWSLLASRLFPGTFEDPSGVDLPPTTEVEQTRSYLAADGYKVVQFREITSSLTSEEQPSSEGCRAVVEERLPALGTPEEILASIEGVTDPSLREMAVGHLDASRRWLASCLDGSPDRRDEIIFTGTILDRRLEQVRP